MHSFSFTKNTLLLDGKPIYLNSGEFHYFRVPKADWRRRMELLKAAGGNCLATYIPWLVHEPEEGRFILDEGDGITDFTEFVQCAQEVGLYVIARPGPYVYSELINHGLPTWLLKRYPEIQAQNRKGEVFNTRGCISYLHPNFLEKVKRWYDFICPVIARFTRNNGGPIILVQLDNEVAGIQIWSGSRDFNREAMGFGTEDGLYPTFLSDRYGTIAAVNEAYGTTHVAFAEFRPEDEAAMTGLVQFRWNRDYIDFYNGTIATYLQTLAVWAREGGIVETQFCHNAGCLAMLPTLREAKRRMGDDLLIGSDHYFCLSQTWGSNNPTPQQMIPEYLDCEMMRLFGNPPTIMELQYGNIADWIPTAKEDLLAHLMTYVGYGLRGHNGYIFTGGPNPPGTGNTCLVYDYGAPVAADGTCRPSYDAIREFGKFIATHGDVFVGDTADTDMRILMPWDELVYDDGTLEPKRGPSYKMFFEWLRRGVLTGAFASGIMPEFCDPESDEWTRDVSTPVFVPSAGVMAAAVQRRLADFVLRGGRVILSPVIPYLDERLCPCTVLADALGASSGEVMNFSGQKFIDYAGSDFAMDTPHSIFVQSARRPDKARTLLRELATGAECGWVAEIGQGTVVFAGATVIIERAAHIEMFQKLFAAAGGVMRWRSDNAWVLSLRRRTADGQSLVFLANLGSSRQSVHAEIRRDSATSWKTLPPIDLAPMEVRLVPIGY